jgi:sterol desaturase/sphingolipid hydroxylase (fatty acid hydroxylase superfamily)
LCFLLGQYLLFNGAVFWILSYAQRWIYVTTPHALRDFIGGLNVCVQAVIVVLLGDFLIYWGHRLQHRVGFLWRFHCIHHSAEHLDWLAAHREHPVDSIYTILLVNLPIFALGFPIRSLALFAAFRGLWAIYIHANVRLPIGPLRMLIGAPELHHWHHERTRDAGNYANVSPLMDLLFGTYRCPDHEPASLGVEEPMPQGYFGQLMYPFLKRRKSLFFAKAPKNRAQALAGPEIGRAHSEAAAACGDRGPISKSSAVHNAANGTAEHLAEISTAVD